MKKKILKIHFATTVNKKKQNAHTRMCIYTADARTHEYKNETPIIKLYNFKNENEPI